jgi:nitrite reductase/ring-hydroxylating ferredoxin subunit
MKTESQCQQKELTANLCEHKQTNTWMVVSTAHPQYISVTTGSTQHNEQWKQRNNQAVDTITVQISFNHIITFIFKYELK